MPKVLNDAEVAAYRQFQHLLSLGEDLGHIWLGHENGS